LLFLSFRLAPVATLLCTLLHALTAPTSFGADFPGSSPAKDDVNKPFSQHDLRLSGVRQAVGVGVRNWRPFSAFAQVNKLIVVYKMLLHGSSTKMLTLINGGMLALSKAGGKREEKRRKSAEASVQQLHVRWEHAFFPHHPKDLCRLGHRGSS